MASIEQMGGDNSPDVIVEKGNTIADVLGKGLNRKVKYSELVVGSLELQRENPDIQNVNLIEVGMQIKIPENLNSKIKEILSNPEEYASYKKRFEEQYRSFVRGELQELKVTVEEKKVQTGPPIEPPTPKEQKPEVLPLAEFPTYEEIAGKLDTTLDSKISEAPGDTIVNSPHKDKAILTFDVCSCYHSSPSRYNDVLRSFDLIETQTDTPVTLFVTADALSDPKYYQRLKDLSALPHVSVQAHGYAHKPVTTKHRQKIWGQQPTGDLRAAYDEIVEGAKAVQELTGKKPLYFRSATLYSDAIAEKMVRALGMELVARSDGADDAGGTLKNGGDIRHGDVYLGHLINYEGVSSVYRKIKSSNLNAAFLA